MSRAAASACDSCGRRPGGAADAAAGGAGGAAGASGAGAGCWAPARKKAAIEGPAGRAAGCLPAGGIGGGVSGLLGSATKLLEGKQGRNSAWRKWAHAANE